MDRLTYGMVGGDLKSFIGNVHRQANALDPRVKLVSGCFSRHEDKNNDCGDTFGIDRTRLFTDWREMLKNEAAREDKIDFVSVCTPNHLHYEVCKAFLEAGINVVCEKPLCFEVNEAEELARQAEAQPLGRNDARPVELARLDFLAQHEVTVAGAAVGGMTS